MRVAVYAAVPEKQIMASKQQLELVIAQYSPHQAIPNRDSGHVSVSGPYMLTLGRLAVTLIACATRRLLRGVCVFRSASTLV